eukprot:Clim_evm5s7 gene=Clim_evmTU5s7
MSATVCPPNNYGAGIGYIPSNLTYSGENKPFECSGKRKWTLEEAQRRLSVYAPILFEHPDEPYHLTDVQHFLADAWIFQDGKNTTKRATNEEMFKITRDHPNNGTNSDFQLVQASDDYSGDAPRFGKLLTAPIYGQVYQDDAGFWVYSYYYFFEYNGCTGQSVVYNTTEHDKEAVQYVSICTVGIHQGDWEYMQVAVCPDEREPVGVSLQAHGYTNYMDCRSQDCHLWRTHPVVFLALGGHASYYEPGAQYNQFIPKELHTDHMDLAALTDFTGVGPIFWPHRKNVILLPPKDEIDASSDFAWALWQYSFGGFEDPEVLNITCYDDHLKKVEECPTDENFQYILNCIGLKKDGNCTVEDRGKMQVLFSQFTQQTTGPVGPYMKAQATSWQADKPLPASEQNYAMCPGGK